jgi:SanA protein
MRRGLLCAVTLLAILLGAHTYVLCSAWGEVYSLGDAPPRDVIIVLGASVRPDGSPSQMLEERLHAAADLYFAGRAPMILVTGDQGEDYDEVGSMVSDLIARGVPTQAILQDGAGFRTLDSMYRAQRVFGVNSALVVTNPFHVSRAVFLGKSCGMDAVGVEADYGTAYSVGTRLRHAIREAGARILAFCDVFLLGTQPGR